MNVAQCIRKAHHDMDSIHQDSTTDPFFFADELLVWANDGKDLVEKTLRQAKMDYNLLLVRSTDSAYRWAGVTYDPAVMKMSSTSKRVQLPPDVQEIKRIRCLTNGFQALKFQETDMSRDEFKRMENSITPPSSVIYWDLVGENTMYLANTPSATIDIELAYVARSTPMQMYSTGSVTLVNGSASVSGGGTAWSADELLSNLELIVSDDATAPKVTSKVAGGTWVIPGAQYYPVSAIDSDGGLTLAGTWLKASASGRGYILATVPPIPSEHHALISDYVAQRMAIKAGSDQYKLLQDKFERGLAAMKSDIQERQMADPEYVEAFDPTYVY